MVSLSHNPVLRSFSSSIILSLILGLFSLAHSAEEQTETAAQTQNPAPVVSRPVPWSANPQQIAMENPADEVAWLDIDNEKYLVLKYWAKGKKKRGTIILLHAQGENPAHPRLIQPLARQFSHFGWQVLAPYFPDEDFEIQTTQASTQSSFQQEQTEKTTEQSNIGKTVSEATTQAPSQNGAESVDSQVAEDPKATDTTDHYFASIDAYQEKITLILQKTQQLNSENTLPLVIIGNQHSNYWLLDMLKQQALTTHIVMISPQIPDGVEEALKEKLTDKKQPLYLFVTDELISKPFTQALAQKTRSTPAIRINQSFLSQDHLVLENYFLVKTISGWAGSRNN